MNGEELANDRETWRDCGGGPKRPMLSQKKKSINN